MSEKKITATTHGLFDRQNLRLMFIGALVIVLGMVLMVGGKSSDPAVFNEREVYSFTRITVAPVLIVAGLVIEIVAIFKKPKS
ncbi:MAG TPA: DUF3098 domain-containing protein [Chitinophagaceae bacterium]|nr:DUF3098 domain-containing protein [Chitinophagaceae bacterium]